ncbi:hypothetical protein [Anaerosporobacter sp.]|uniref:hypothetical protein n=1 Tax=Anaerosporobacter sp. TaxID=1872529 RepID=UPI00286ED667|nr:hypothetical protein [Anaerosporobacter sp.]
MNKLIILILFFTISLTACHSKALSNNHNDESNLTIESSSTDNTLDEKGSITNPYSWSDESFQITCQVPDYGKESEIVLEFSSMHLTLHDSSSWTSSGYVTLITGNTVAPIHINDYITVLFYNSNGIVGATHNTILDSDTDDNTEFIFKQNNNISGSINTRSESVSKNEQVPKVACIKYFDGSNYKEVFFCRYEYDKPLGIND